MQDMCIIPRPSETTLKERLFPGKVATAGDRRREILNETAIFSAI